MEDQIQDSPAVAAEAQAALSPLQVDALTYAAVAFLVACVVVFVNNDPMVRQAGFFAKAFSLLVGAGLGAVGALIGNALRKAVHPDAVFTTGGFWSLLWVKVFWKWGPQTIGMLIGIFVGVALVLK